MREQEALMMAKYGGMKPKKKGLMQAKVCVEAAEEAGPCWYACTVSHCANASSPSRPLWVRLVWHFGLHICTI